MVPLQKNRSYHSVLLQNGNPILCSVASPHLTQWKLMIPVEESVEDNGQMPLPANVYQFAWLQVLAFKHSLGIRLEVMADARDAKRPRTMERKTVEDPERKSVEDSDVPCVWRGRTYAEICAIIPPEKFQWPDTCCEKGCACWFCSIYFGLVKESISASTN